MKRILVLLMAILIALALSAPLYALAEAPAEAPPDTGQTVFLEPVDAPIVETATEEAQETDPGGALIDLTDLFQALWSVLVLIITRYAVPWLRARFKAEKLAEFDYWSTIAVAAAEKAYGAGKGAQKLKYAEEILRAHGFTVDTDVVDALIKQLFDDDKIPETIA